MARRRGVRHRNTPPGRRFERSLLFALALACGEQDRPDPLPDPLLRETRRFVGGSFGAPSLDGAGGAAGAGAPADAGIEQGGGSSGSANATAGAAATSTSPDPVSQRKTYEATCGESQMVQWGFVTYEANTPGDSLIELRLRPAPTEADLAAQSFIELISASTALGTDRCTVTGPAPDCPIDLFVRLGGAPLVHLPFMEVEAVLHPASANQRLPGVGAWRMDYSCLDAL